MSDEAKVQHVEIIKRLHEKHVKRYATRLKMALEGNPVFRAEELKHYLTLWEEVEAVGFDFEKLTKPAKLEVIEAYEDEGLEAPLEWYGFLTKMS